MSLDATRLTPKVHQAIADGVLDKHLALHFSALGNGIQDLLVDRLRGVQEVTEISRASDTIAYDHDAALKAALAQAKDYKSKFEMHAERSRRIAMEFKLYKVSKGDMA